MIDLKGVSAESLSDTIGAIYDCALDPGRWDSTVRQIVELCDSRSGGICVHRVLGDPRYGEGETNLFNLLSPHICRALAISDLLDIGTVHSDTLQATLDGLAAGVYLVRRDGRIVHMNAAAVEQARRGKALRVVSNRLLPSDRQTAENLAQAIDDISRAEKQSRPSNRSMAIQDADGTGYVATLLRIEGGRRRGITAPLAASVAIFAQEPQHVSSMPGEAFARLYELTGGELRVLLTLARGLGAKKAAEMLGIGEPTVRTHLQRMFLKTRTSRQAELLQLLQSYRPPTKVC